MISYLTFCKILSSILLWHVYISSPSEESSSKSKIEHFLHFLCQFHQHFMLEFFRQKHILQLFSNYRLALLLFGKRLSAKEALEKCWWFWHQVRTSAKRRSRLNVSIYVVFVLDLFKIFLDRETSKSNLLALEENDNTKHTNLLLKISSFRTQTWAFFVI